MYSIVHISAQHLVLHITHCRLRMEISGFCYSNLGTEGRYVFSFVPPPLGIMPLVPLKQEAGWTPGPVWALSGR